MIAVSSKDREWMKARGLFLFKDQLVIPSVCTHLGAENIGQKHYAEQTDGHYSDVSNEKWVCRCMIQDKKSKVCAEGRCMKKLLPGIEDAIKNALL